MFLGDELSREQRRRLARATRGGVVLRPGQYSSTKVRNATTGRIFPCCYSPCWKDANVNIELRVNHELPRWRDPVTGDQEKVVYTFCSDTCKSAYFREMLANR